MDQDSIFEAFGQYRMSPLKIAAFVVLLSFSALITAYWADTIAVSFLRLMQILLLYFLIPFMVLLADSFIRAYAARSNYVKLKQYGIKLCVCSAINGKKRTVWIPENQIRKIESDFETHVVVITATDEYRVRHIRNAADFVQAANTWLTDRRLREKEYFAEQVRMQQDYEAVGFRQPVYLPGSAPAPVQLPQSVPQPAAESAPVPRKKKLHWDDPLRAARQPSAGMMSAAQELEMQQLFPDDPEP